MMEPDREVFVAEVRAFKTARDRHREQEDEESLQAVEAAARTLEERIGPMGVRSVATFLDQLGDDFIDALTVSPSRFEDDEPVTPFEEAMRTVEHEKILEACVRLGVDLDTSVAILMAFDNGKECGKDEFAEHDQDPEAFVLFHLELIEEAREHGESRRY
jgi:hypothetical protein